MLWYLLPGHHGYNSTGLDDIRNPSGDCTIITEAYVMFLTKVGKFGNIEKKKDSTNSSYKNFIFEKLFLKNNKYHTNTSLMH